MSSSTQYESGLHPVPVQVEDKQVYGSMAAQPPYPGAPYAYTGFDGQVPEEKRWFGMRRSTVILSAVIFVLLAGIGAIGGVFGSKIGKLEAQLPPTA